MNTYGKENLITSKVFKITDSWTYFKTNFKDEYDSEKTFYFEYDFITKIWLPHSVIYLSIYNSVTHVRFSVTTAHMIIGVR